MPVNPKSGAPFFTKSMKPFASDLWAAVTIDPNDILPLNTVGVDYSCTDLSFVLECCHLGELSSRVFIPEYQHEAKQQKKPNGHLIFR